MSWLDAGSSADRYLPDTVRRLWPAPARLTAPRRWQRPGEPGRSYLVVPSAARAKVVVPQHPRRVAAGAIRGFKSTQSRRESIVLAGLAAALRAGLGAVLPDRLHVADSSGAEDLESALASRLGRPVRISLHVSEPRAVRKPVLQLLDEHGRTFAFAKLGVDAFTDSLVRAEGSAVDEVGARARRVLRVPRVLHAGDWDGHALLVQSAAPRGREPEQAPELVAAAMDELARGGGPERVPLATSGFWVRLVERADALPASTHRDDIRSSLSAAERHCADAEIDFGAWHGDWTPWNMNVAGGAVHVWDWEKFETGVPIGLDAVHFDVQRAIVRRGQPPSVAFRAAVERAESIVSPHRLAGADARLIVWLYILTIAVRYLEDGELDAGRTAAVQLSTWLPEALRQAEAATIR